jgi:putative acetyltransferase
VNSSACLWRREFRGRGAAQGLLGQLEASAAQLGCKDVLLETGPYQHEALAFYEKQGLPQAGTLWCLSPITR